MRAAWADGGPTHLVFSNHGIPVKYVEQGDPYQAQVERTNALVAAALELAPEGHSGCYQSRFGPTIWLQPRIAAPCCSTRPSIRPATWCRSASR